MRIYLYAPLYFTAFLFCGGTALAQLDLMVGAKDGICYAFENTGTIASPVWTARPAWNTPDVGIDVVPALADLDGDGDMDILIGEDTYGGAYGYRNTGSANNPVWTAVPAWNTPSVGAAPAPALADLDGDGDYDLLIGEELGVAFGYENTGTIASPVWTAKPAWNTPDAGDGFFADFADLDNDGDKDYMVGEALGVVYAYRNTGTAASPVWTANASWNTPDAGATVDAALGDLDGDNDYDLIIGASTGRSYGYENTGTAITPAWTARPAWDVPDIGAEATPAFGNLGLTTLPVKFASVRAEVLENGKVSINWVTHSESNNSHFTVERSSETLMGSPNADFEEIVSIKGAGNSSSVISYGAVDALPLTGVAYYRIRQTDYDNRSSYSVTVSINYAGREYDAPDNFSVDYGNMLNIRASSGDEVIVVVYDMNGKTVFSRITPVYEDGSCRIALDPEGRLTEGIYFVKASSDGRLYNQKLIIQ